MNQKDCQFVQVIILYLERDIEGLELLLPSLIEGETQFLAALALVNLDDGGLFGEFDAIAQELKEVEEFNPGLVKEARRQLSDLRP